MTTVYRVGLVGVGLMGHGIASSLLRAGHSLCFLEHAGNQPVEDLVAAGAVPLASGREVAQQADIVILCVTGSPQVEAVLFEPDGVLDGLRPGSVVVDCSTALPSSTARGGPCRGGRRAFHGRRHDAHAQGGGRRASQPDCRRAHAAVRGAAAVAGSLRRKHRPCR